MTLTAKEVQQIIHIWKLYGNDKAKLWSDEAIDNELYHHAPNYVTFQTLQGDIIGFSRMSLLDEEKVVVLDNTVIAPSFRGCVAGVLYEVVKAIKGDDISNWSVMFTRRDRIYKHNLQHLYSKTLNLI